MRGFGLFIGVLVVLCLAHWRALASPPYVEQAVALFTEASFLADSSFDYRRLLSEPHADMGGPHTYVTTILPTMLALAMRFFGTRGAIVAAHLTTMAAIAFACVVVFLMLERRIGRGRSALWTMALATTPFVSVMTEMTSMDAVLMAAISPCAWLVERRRWLAALAVSCLAFTFRNTAFVFPFSVAVYVGVWMLFDAMFRRAISKRQAIVFALAVAIFLLQWLVMSWGGNTRSRVRWSLEVGLWFASTPDVLLLTIATLIATGDLARRRLALASTVELLPQQHALGSAIPRLLSDEPLLFVSVAMVLATHASVLPVTFECRYLSPMMPFLILLAGSAFSGADRARKWAYAVPLGLVLLNLANQDGKLFPPLNEQIRRGWGVPERSHEYWADHQSNLAASKLLWRLSERTAILATDRFTHFLQAPRLGYVPEGLAGDPPPYRYCAEHANIQQLLKDRPGEIIVTRVADQTGEKEFPAISNHPPLAGDQVLFDDGLEPDHIVYRRVLGRDQSDVERLRALVELLFRPPSYIDPAVCLIVVGYANLSFEYLELESSRSIPVEDRRKDLVKRIETTLDRLGDTAHAELSAEARQHLRELLLRRKDELVGLREIVPLRPAEQGVNEFVPQRVRYFPRRVAN